MKVLYFKWNERHGYLIIGLNEREHWKYGYNNNRHQNKGKKFLAFLSYEVFIIYGILTVWTVETLKLEYLTVVVQFLSF